MSIKLNVLSSLQQSRKMLDGLIAATKTQEDWLHQVHPKANHPLWVVGHLGLADNMFLSKLDGAADKKPAGWEELFWFGSEISGDASLYPAPEEVVNYARDRRERLLATLEATPEDVLLSPPPKDGMFADAPNVAQMFIFAAYHEGLHTGQFTIAHRALGNPPLFQPSSEPAAQ